MKADVSKEKGIWTVKINKDVIKVQNKSNVVKLYINDELQDICMAASVSFHLYGKLSNGKEVKVSIIGEFKVHCYIFVDSKCVMED